MPKPEQLYANDAKLDDLWDAILQLDTQLHETADFTARRGLYRHAKKGWIGALPPSADTPDNERLYSTIWEGRRGPLDGRRAQIWFRQFMLPREVFENHDPRNGLPEVMPAVERLFVYSITGIKRFRVLFTESRQQPNVFADKDDPCHANVRPATDIPLAIRAQLVMPNMEHYQMLVGQLATGVDYASGLRQEPPSA